MSNMNTVEGVKAPKKANKESLISTFFKGIGSNNPGLCQLLGLCPLLAVTTSAVSALGLGIATLLVLCASSFLVSIVRRCIYKEVRIPIYVLIIATFVTLIQFYVQAYFPSLYDELGIYLALIVTNCIIMGRAEAFAGHNNPIQSFMDALGCGIGFMLVLFALGSLREIIGAGTWFSGAGNLLGEFGKSLECSVIPQDYTLMIGILPPGGFILLALLIALKNYQSTRRSRKYENSFKIKSIQN